MAFTDRSRPARDAILAAARRRFADEGYDRATVRAIAGDAGVDPSMVIRYFGSKRELFTAAAEFDLRDGRRAWVQVARGTLSVNGTLLTEGDGLAVTEPGRLSFGEGSGAEILLFDLARVR